MKNKNTDGRTERQGGGVLATAVKNAENTALYLINIDGTSEHGSHAAGIAIILVYIQLSGSFNS